MAKKINEALVKTGMDRDSHPSNIQNNTTYTHAKNANIENENGEFLVLKNEKSNILATKFKAGFKVIHAVNDIDTTNTYFFLVNPTTGVGEFGIIENNQSVPNLEDTLVACGDCSYYNELSEPLEGIEQVALQTYTTLLSDACTTPENGFNFNVLNPIKTSIIKNEKTGKTIYFSHKGNPPRYINVDRIGDYFIKEEPCADDTALTCPDFDKMRVFKLFSIPKLTPLSIELGGNLKMGVYEFLVAYCNSEGQEISEYYSISTPISIFDENNQIQGQPNTSDRTNMSIRLSIENLDSKYTHYKIAVVQTADIEGATRYFEEGVHTINDSSILYSTEQNKKETSIDILTRSYLFVEEAEGVATANNVLYQYGVTNKKEINLQPVVNFLGEIAVKWQTHIASEDLYENGINVNKFKGYNREEVVPLSIKFGLKGGHETATFPLIARLPKEEDLEAVATLNRDRQSVENNKTCIAGSRDQRWKMYDTSSVEDGYCVGDIETNEVEETISRFCTVENIAEVPSGEATIWIDTEYTNLEDYINTTVGESYVECSNAYISTTQDICAVLYDDYEDITCPMIKIVVQVTSLTPTIGTSSVNIGGDLYSIVFNTDEETTVSDFVTVNAAAILLNTGAIITSGGSSINFYGATTTVTVVSNSGDISSSTVELFEDNCSIPQIVGSKVIISNIVGETKTDIESIFPTEYAKMSPPKIECSLYERASSDLSARYQLDYEASYDPPLGWTCDAGLAVVPFLAYIRDSDFINQECAYATEIILNQNPGNNTTEPFFLNYDYDETFANILLPQTSGAATAGLLTFPANLTKTALWFNGNTENKTRFIIDVSKQRNSSVGDTVSISPFVRFTLFDSCSSTTHIYSKLIDVSQGGIFLLEKVGTSDLRITDSAGVQTLLLGKWFFSRKYLVAIDCPYNYMSTIYNIVGGNLDDCLTLELVAPRWVIFPTSGCMTISKRDIEYSKALVTWESIKLSKELEYEASCTYDQPVVKSCTAVPYKKGEFSFWKSEDTYPDNNELYNSSNLVISPEQIPEHVRTKFYEAYVEEIVDNEYVWKEDEKPLTDFTCREIRHFKFPSNKVAPFTWDNKQKAFSSTIIFPIGFTIDEEVIVAMLDIALSNGLITAKERAEIVSYEILRGDLTTDRSITASGLLYDMRTYTEGVNKYLYSNYPYNSYCNDKLNNLPLTSKFGIENSNYTFHSPETDYGRPEVSSEISVQGYLFGNSKGHFDEVAEHPKYVIISDKARALASSLALLEVAAEVTIASLQALSNAQVWTVLGTGSAGASLGTPAFAASAGISILGSITGGVFKYGRYRYEWLKIFTDLGSPKNFAYYYYSSGHYNYMRLLQNEGDMVRGVNVGKYLKEGNTEYTNEVTSESLKINNTFRERSVFLSLGDFPIRYNSVYSNYDKTAQTSSMTSAGECNIRTSGKSIEIRKNIASPYVYTKNYKPSQHGSIDSIKWLTTGFRRDLDNPRTDCLPIFGGDTYITRHTVKRKHAQFLVNAMEQADRTPFNYFFYNNIGRNPKFYLSYGVDKDFEGGGKIFPNVENDFIFDTKTSGGNYLTQPSKFYLYYYGVPSFLCETRINTNFRYAETPLQRQFYPQVGDLENWTQEKNVSIREPEYFFYNKAYSKQVTRLKSRTLADNYNKELNDVRTDFPNGILSSLPDNSENNTYDPWLIYRPLDFFEFPTNFGKLKHVQGIENEAIFVRFENTSILYNKVDYTNDDGQSPTRPFLGGTSAFQRRSSSFYNAQLGFGGSQNTTSVSCEFGHFHVDAKRGQVIQTQPSGQQMEEISAMIGGKPSGMRAWFKEHLPFKILKYFKDVDVDNNYNGVGITMAWDSRYRRVFITKKDYIPTNPAITHLDGKYFLGETEVFLTDNTKFLDVSWTIAFSPILGAWMSFYDFKPNYYVSHNEYFQSGVNNTGSKFGLWSHGLTNKSFGVFYGDKYSFDVEYMVKNEYATKRLDSVSLFTEAKRYHNEYDWSFNPDLTFNKSLIHNNVACSGYLNLIPQRNNFFNNKNYPKTNTDGTQDILISNKDNFQWNYNYFYNRVQNNNSNIPFINYDKNQIEKSINSNIVGFKGKRVLDRISGDYFLNRLSYNTDSRFSLGLKFTLNEVDI